MRHSQIFTKLCRCRFSRNYALKVLIKSFLLHHTWSSIIIPFAPQFLRFYPFPLSLTFSGKRKENAWKELSEYQKECGVKNDSDTRMESYLYGTEEYLIGQKMRVLFSLSSKLFLMMALFISAFFVNGIKILSELSGYERRYEFLRCMGMKQKQRRKTIRFETQMLSDIALFATVMMGIVYVLSYEWRCASKDAGSLDVTFWMYWILIVGIYLLADRLVQWLFAQYVIKRVEKGND